EVVHALEGDVQAQVTFAGQGVGHVEGHARLHRLEARVEVVDVDLEELAIGHGRQWFGGLAGEIGHHAHDEGQLDLFLGAVEFHVIFDLYPRRAVACDEFLTAGDSHVAPPSPKGDCVWASSVAGR